MFLNIYNFYYCFNLVMFSYIKYIVKNEKNLTFSY